MDADHSKTLSTLAIVAWRSLGRSIDQQWVDWAVGMLEKGHDSYHLRILAGEPPPFNQFDLRSIVDSVFDELDIDCSDQEKSVKDYASYLIREMLGGRMNAVSVLRTLKDICLELDYAEYLYDFYSLYFAQEDLATSNIQRYWIGMTKENIEQEIFGYSKRWLQENGYKQT